MILILVLLVLLILLVLVLLILLVLLSSASSALVLQHLLGIGIILLGIHIAWIPEEGLPVRFDRRSPVFLHACNVTEVVEIVGAVAGNRGCFLDLVQGSAGLIVESLPVEGGGKVVTGSYRGAVLDQGPAVIDLGLLPMLLVEFTVAGTDFLAIRLRPGVKGA